MTRGEHARAPPLNRLLLLPLFAPRAVSKATREEGRLSVSARAAFPSALPSRCRSRARRAPSPRRAPAEPPPERSYVMRRGAAGSRYVPCSDAAVRDAGHNGAAAVGPAGRAGRPAGSVRSGRAGGRRAWSISTAGKVWRRRCPPANFPRRGDRGCPGAGGWAAAFRRAARGPGRLKALRRSRSGAVVRGRARSAPRCGAVRCCHVTSSVGRFCYVRRVAGSPATAWHGKVVCEQRVDVWALSLLRTEFRTRARWVSPVGVSRLVLAAG